MQSLFNNFSNKITGFPTPPQEKCLKTPKIIQSSLKYIINVILDHLMFMECENHSLGF